MPRYKDSPEVMAAKKERKKKLREFFSLLDAEDMSDLKSIFKEMVGEVLENSLEGELDDELGYSRYDYRNKDTENSRNEHSRKTVKTSCGAVEIAVPRDRNGDFEPHIIKKNETSLSGDIEEKIISMYAKGMTTNDISAHKDIKALMADLKKVYGAIDEETALYELEQFASKWDSKYPKISSSWRAHWPELSTYFKYPQSVRTLIYTTNAIESFNRQLRKVTKNKAVFPNDDSLLKMLYMAQVDITKKWTCRRRDWGEIRSQLEIFFAERLPQ